MIFVNLIKKLPTHLAAFIALTFFVSATTVSPSIAATTTTAAATTANAAGPKNYDVDVDHSHVGFKIRHLISKTAGEFREFEGSFTFNEKKPTESSVNFSIKVDSLNTRNKKRDDHLKSEEFFDAGKFEKITFLSKKITAAGKNKIKILGDMTMHGVTKPVTFDAEYTGTATDPWGNLRSGFTAHTTLNRKDFGIVWNKTVDKGGLMLGDDVEVELEIEGIEKKPADAAAAHS